MPEYPGRVQAAYRQGFFSIPTWSGPAKRSDVEPILGSVVSMNEDTDPKLTVTCNYRPRPVGFLRRSDWERLEG